MFMKNWAEWEIALIGIALILVGLGAIGAVIYAMVLALSSLL